MSVFLLDRVRLVFTSPFLMIRKGLPTKGKAPVKIPAVMMQSVRWGFHELKRVQVNGGDVRTHYGGGVLRYPGQQWLKPSVETFT